MGGDLSQGAIWTPCGRHLAKDLMTASVWGCRETMLCLNLSSLSWLCRQVTISQWDNCWNNCAISCSPAEQVWWYFHLVLTVWFLEQRLGKGKVIMGFQSQLHLCTNISGSACSWERVTLGCEWARCWMSDRAGVNRNKCSQSSSPWGQGMDRVTGRCWAWFRFRHSWSALRSIPVLVSLTRLDVFTQRFYSDCWYIISQLIQQTPWYN